MDDERRVREEPAHDVLAAEEFAMPAPDPALHEEAVHDVLAAEEFGMPAPDPTIHHAPVTLPTDLTGAEEPRDVLAAEEFAMPASPPHSLGPATGVSGGDRLPAWAKAAMVAIAVLVLRRLARRGR